MRLTGYRIEEPIGQGGMATVYRAIQESLERPVALKVLSDAFAGTEEFTTRFINEGRLVASLHHSNVVTIYDIGAEDGRHFIAMEYLGGGNLRALMRGGIDVCTALGHAAIIADALAAAHEKHIVHRDVKPANVLFRADGTLVLSDFGIAKHLVGDSDLTLPGSTLGSPHYLSPEQARGQPVDGRADVYSLGIICFEMLTGTRPYSGQSEIDVALKHVTEPVPRLPEHLSALQPLLDRMLAKAPGDRLECAAGAAEALRAARETWSALETGGRTPSALQAAPTLVLNPDAPPPAAPPTHAKTIVLGPEDAAAPLHEDPEPTIVERADRVAGAMLGALKSAASDLLAEHAPSPGAGDAGTGGPATGDRAARVRLLLAKAERAIEEFRLTEPEDDCALGYVEQALALDPENPEARSGARRIGDRHASLVYARLGRLEMGEAKRHLDRGLAVDPDNAKLKGLAPLLAGVTATERSSSTRVGAARDETGGWSVPSGIKSRLGRLFERDG